MTAWFAWQIALENSFFFLDYGAGGRFFRRIPGDKFVCENSDVAPADGIVSVRDASQLKSYSYIQLLTSLNTYLNHSASFRIYANT